MAGFLNLSVDLNKNIWERFIRSSILTASLCLYQTKQRLFFELEEEDAALLLLLPKFFAEIAVFGLGSGFCCWLVVAIVQARTDKTALFCSSVK
ncbi:hypothetical protein GX563_09325 [Candidatus Bathyarchaeota archaeon]|nr:hypothetical protein [Candidatus Bathyarchaeota archaeon]